jgi:hypothetical protein
VEEAVVPLCFTGWPVHGWKSDDFFTVKSGNPLHIQQLDHSQKLINVRILSLARAKAYSVKQVIRGSSVPRQSTPSRIRRRSSSHSRPARRTHWPFSFSPICSVSSAAPARSLRQLCTAQRGLWSSPVSSVWKTEL